jgi:23S rRNA (cytosine1962-C5)-methyltransferase
VAKALNAYRRLARLGLAVLRRGGILVAASCSRPVQAGDFYAAVHEAAASMKRPLHEIERTGHALDHPIGFKEGAYLKCLFAQAG